MSDEEWGMAAGSDFTFDGDGVSTDELGRGGDNVERPGWYHWEIVDVVPELEYRNKRGNPKSPSIRFDFVVLHTVDGQSPAGARHFHHVYVGDKDGGPAKEGSRNSALRFGLGLGLLKEIEANGVKSIVDARTGATKIGIDIWKRAKGMQCISKVEMRAPEGNYPAKAEIPFGRVFQLDDPAVKDVPRNAEAAAMAQAAPSNTIPKAAPTGARQQPAPQTVPAEDDLSDL